MDRFQKMLLLSKYLISNFFCFLVVGKKQFIDMQYSIMANTLQDESPIPCGNETNFEFDNCFYQSMEKNLMDQFNCVVPFISPMSGKGK